MREIFVYWHCRPMQADAAIATSRECQLRWRERWPELATHLYRRDEPERSRVTVMEHYACASGGFPEEAERAIVNDGSRALASWLEGTRHVEIFERLID